MDGKKKSIIGVIAIVAVIGLLLVFTVDFTEMHGYIGKAKAIEIAHNKVYEDFDDSEISSVNLENENGKTVYKVAIVGKGGIYTATIDAKTGEYLGQSGVMNIDTSNIQFN